MDPGPLIRQLQGTLAFLAGKQIQIGTDEMTWTASTNAGPITIAHDLGRVPTMVFAFNADTAGSYGGIASYSCPVSAYTSAGFDVYGRAPSSISETKAIFWVAIG